MAQHLDAEVIVVGGGPAGASTAWALAREGVDVLLLDRARFPRDKVCAEYLSPQASRILSDMGILDQVEASGAAHLRGMRVRSPDGHSADGEFASRHHGFHGFRDKGLAIRRMKLDPIVLSSARKAGARVEESMRVTDLTRNGGARVSGVTVLDGDGATHALRARYVVGADGLRSVVGRRLNLVRTSRIWPRRIALVTHYRNIQGVTNIGEMHVDYGGYFGIVEVDGGLMNVAVVIPQSRARTIGDKTAFLEEWIASRPHLAERFIGAERLTPVHATGPFATASRRPWAPGAALVGDAADFFDPFTGEGIYAALRGGELLAPHLIEALGREKEEKRVLDGYDRARKREFGGKWKLERIVGMTIAYPWFINNAAKMLSQRKDLADLLVGVAGDFIPPRLVLTPNFLFRLFISPAFRS